MEKGDDEKKMMMEKVQRKFCPGAIPWVPADTINWEISTETQNLIMTLILFCHLKFFHSILILGC